MDNKWCNYCNGSKWLINLQNNKPSKIQADIEFGQLRVATYDDSTVVAINYCPMCGRDLLKE